jgi:hypothetical protein
LKKIEGEMSRSQLMQALQLKDRVNFTRMSLEPALALNLIKIAKDRLTWAVILHIVKSRAGWRGRSSFYPRDRGNVI